MGKRAQWPKQEAVHLAGIGIKTWSQDGPDRLDVDEDVLKHNWTTLLWRRLALPLRSTRQPGIGTYGLPPESVTYDADAANVLREMA